ncbi:MAG TPA: DUF4124 domain-containing protein [Burkholderiaceae bacterium]
MNTLLKSFLLALLLASACAQAQVYECIDANGRKSFTTQCPPNTVKAKEMHPEVTDPGAPVTPREKIKALEDTYSRQRAMDKAKTAEQEQQAEDARDSARACADARARLDALQSGRQAKRVDPVTGEHVPMDDDARQSQISGLKREIADNCR